MAMPPRMISSMRRRRSLSGSGFKVSFKGRHYKGLKKTSSFIWRDSARTRKRYRITVYRDQRGRIHRKYRIVGGIGFGA